MPTDNQGTRSRAGGMSVSLASPDGRVVGGGVAGVLIAATPVQVSILSFSYTRDMFNNAKSYGVLVFNPFHVSVDCRVSYTNLLKQETMYNF